MDHPFRQIEKVTVTLKVTVTSFLCWLNSLLSTTLTLFLRGKQ